MPAIADSDDLYAWLIRGFVESGLPDHTRGGQEWTAAGALNLENFIQGQGAGGVLLQFRGQAGDSPAPEDDYTYQVCVVRGPEGSGVAVRSEDTLFHHIFPADPAIAATIVGELRAHNDTFTQWRAKGGTTNAGQRRALPDVRGASADRALITVLETLRRANRSVVEGPANKWWVKAGGPAGSLKIEAGLGQEPVYITRKQQVTLSPEDLEHAERLRFAGLILMISSGMSFLFLILATGYAGFDIWRFNSVTAQGYSTIFSVCASVLFAAMHGYAGFRLRSLRSRGLVRIVAILGMLPCVAPCCLMGLPLGAWVVYLLQDERSTRVFND